MYFVPLSHHATTAERINRLERENQRLREVISDMLDRQAIELARERAQKCPICLRTEHHVHIGAARTPLEMGPWEPWSLGGSG